MLGNIGAMSWAVTSLAGAKAVTVDGILEVHRRLLEGTRLEAFGGRIGENQSWIGGSSYNPCSASFVPPPPGKVRLFLEDLCAFSNDDELPAVVQAAIAHAQFETIHPFADGNGRTGRALIHVILRRRGPATHVLPPVSLVLATRAKDYENGLTATRYIGSPGPSTTPSRSRHASERSRRDGGRRSARSGRTRRQIYWSPLCRVPRSSRSRAPRS